VSGFERAALSQIYAGKIQIPADGHRVLPHGSQILQPVNGHHQDQTIPQKLGGLSESAFITESVSQDFPQGYNQYKNMPGSSMMFDTLQYQNETGQTSRTESNGFQGMLMESVVGQPTSSYSHNSAIRTLNFDNVSESDTGGRSGMFQPIQKISQSTQPVRKGDFPALYDGRYRKYMYEIYTFSFKSCPFVSSFCFTPKILHSIISSETRLNLMN